MTITLTKESEKAMQRFSQLIQKALVTAAIAHSGQFRRDGTTPYLNHVSSVATAVRDQGAPEVVVAAAFLHDVLEDTSETAFTLSLRGIPGDVIEIVDTLTHRQGEPYDEYIERISRCPHATFIKIRDIIDNLSDDPSQAQIRKYAKALLVLVQQP